MSCSLLLTLLLGKIQIETIAKAKSARTIPNTIIGFCVEAVKLRFVIK